MAIANGKRRIGTPSKSEMISWGVFLKLMTFKLASNQVRSPKERRLVDATLATWAIGRIAAAVEKHVTSALALWCVCIDGGGGSERIQAAATDGPAALRGWHQIAAGGMAWNHQLDPRQTGPEVYTCPGRENGAALFIASAGAKHAEHECNGGMP